MAEQEIIPAGLPIPGPGRDSKYNTEFNDQARKLCLLGATDAELADFFDVCEATINNWKAQYPAFLASVRAGKTKADAEVADSLYRRATGEEIIVEKAIKGEDGRHAVVTLKQFVPGDVTAQRLWLLNRRKHDWRDKQEIDHSGHVTYSRVERTIVDPANPDG